MHASRDPNTLPSRLRAWGLLLLALDLAACGGSGAPTQPEDSVKLTLRPEATLVSGCFGWPGQEFTAANHANVGAPAVAAGAQAIEFTLLDHAGASHRLSELLATRPVLMVFGGFT